ncbi:MAG: hypothetical protein IJC64_01900 [Clostridia bacterium]|nr:hypothetical protein [Clostridia bacterium]
MYGGVIKNNWVRCELTIRPNEDGVDTYYEDAACGGAIYNCGNFHMYGGTITQNEAYRGAAIYNDEIIRLVSGTISENYSHSYGGAISSSSAQEAQMFIGSEAEFGAKIEFINNKAATGGALYSNASSPILILGNARFEGNESQYGGGAIYTGGALTVRNTEFVGNKTDSSGGAIYFWYNYKDNNSPYFPRRHMELTGCTFTGNEANLGGAIVMSASAEASNRTDYSGSKPKPIGPEGCYAEITDCTFEENHAANAGALYVTRHSDVILKSVEFTSNSCDGVGGAMSVQTGCTATLDDVKFTSNTSGSLGGALYTYAPESISLVNTEFNSNESTGSNGGALYVNGTTLSLDDTVSFIENKAAGHGGALYVSYVTNEDGTRTGSLITINGTVFENNTALSGGAISARSESTVNISNTTFKNCTTPDAQSGKDEGGGAIYSNSSTLTFTDVTFESCKSNYYGGVLKLFDCDVTFEDVTITGAEGGTGAAIYMNTGTLEATDLTLTDVKASVNGSIYLSGVVATFNNLTVKDCVAYQAGAIYASGESTSVTINGGKFENCIATNGGAIFAVKSTVNLNSCTFDNCVATNGGAVYSDQATINVSGTEALPTTFNGNNEGVGSATNSDGSEKSVVASTGGALYMRGSTVIIGENVTFSGYKVGLQGGAIYCRDYVYTVTTPADPTVEGSVETKETFTVPSSLTIDGAKFCDNVAASEGGAIYFSTTSNFEISNTSFERNVAQGHEPQGNVRGGGAIYATASTGYIGTNGQVSFIDNHSNKGGAVAIHSGSTLYVHSVLAQGNYAEYYVTEVEGEQGTETKELVGYGGVFYVNSAHLYLEERDGENDTIVLGGTQEGQGNHAVRGGAICIEKNSIVPTLSVKGAEFINNVSTYVQGESFNNTFGAGAIWTNNTNVTLTGVTLDGNRSNYYGGALQAFGGTFTMNGNSVVKNNAGGTGAALYFSGVTELNIADTEIKDNVSGSNGVVYCANSPIRLENVTASGNVAYSGGVLYASGNVTTITIVGGTYQSNTATNGGAVWANACESISVSGATFKGNSATSETASEPNGGAMLLNSTRIEITDSTFEDNCAKNHGGAMALFATVVNINGNSSFVNNKAGNHGGAIHAMYIWNSDSTARIPSEVVMTGGSFDGNEAVGGGAVSVRSECRASFDGTVFSNNKALGKEDTADGDGEGGGAIYVGWGSLDVANVTMTGNESQGQFGGAINSLYATTTISGTTTITDNSNGIYVVGGAANDLLVKDTLIVTDNETSNVYLAGGRKIKLVGELGEEASIGVASARSGEFVIADGENVTDVMAYKNVFSADLAPIYEENGKLLLGFFVTQNPLSSNNYTFGTNADTATYQWYVLDGGEYSAVEGATSASLPTTVAAGKTYICKATVSRGESYVELTSSAIKYTMQGTQTHPVCGEECSHIGHSNHTWYPISSIDELIIAGKVAGSYYLTCDIETSHSIIIGADVNLCLNGHTLSAKAGDGEFSIITVGKDITFNLTDCGENATSQTVYIKDGQLVDEGTEGATAVVLKGGIISGGHAAIGGAIYSYNSKEINIYNVNFVNNNTTNNGGAIYFGSTNSEEYAVPQYSINNTKFICNSVDNSKYGGAAIYSTRSQGTLNGVTLIGNHSFKGGAIALHTNSTLTVNSLDANGNFAESGDYLDNGTQKTGLGFGGVFYANNSHLEVVGNNGNVSFTNNKAASGGAIFAENNATVSITGASFTSNSTTGIGGAIYLSTTSGSLSVSNSSFTSNTATLYGGAIFAAGDNTLNLEEGPKLSVSLTNCAFSQNTSGSEGGALYLSKCEEYTISGGSFTSNRANLCVRGGGAVYSTGSHGTIINGTRFDGNHGTKGGAIALHSSSSLTVSAATFTNNGAEVIKPCTCDSASDKKCAEGGHGWGGAIYTNGSTLNLVENGGEISFSGNNAVKGGAIYSDWATVTVEGVTFENNGATSEIATNGGAISASNGTLTVEGCTFSGNSVSNTTDIYKQHGGAIYVSSATLNISGTTFTSNTSGYYGGAIAAEGSSTKVTITSSTITGNTESDTADGATGAALWFGSCKEVTVNDVTVSDYHSSYNGVIYTNSQTVNITNLTAEGNTSHNGLIYISGGTLTIKGGKFNKNSATNGGVLCVKGGTVNIEKYNDGEKDVATTFTQNSATYGGAIYVENGTVTIDGAIFGGPTTVEGEPETTVSLGNSATNGGAIYAVGGEVTVNGGTFENNSATNGGAIYAVGGEVTVNGGTFENNSATYGGAVYIGVLRDTSKTNETTNNTLKSAGTFTVAGASFNNNEATEHGGAIYATGAELTINGGSFESNVAKTGHGGALYVTTDWYYAIAGDKKSETYQISKVIITNNVYFGNNEARGTGDNGYGGAIYLSHMGTVGSTLNITGGTFENNKAQYGGAIAGRTGTETTLTGVTFKNNEASVSGGAIYINASSVVVTGGSFEGNSSTYDVSGLNDYDPNKGGGAVFATGSTLKLHGVTLNGNSTGWYGGAIIANSGGSVLIDEGCIIEANVGATGAALHFTGTSVTIKNSSIINNVSSYNGVVYVNGGTILLENVAASGNVAVKGGVLFLSGSADATVIGGTYSSNYASESGAVVYMQNTSKLTVNEIATFMGNGTKTEGEGEEATVKVTLKGGVICVDGGTVTLNGGTFEANTARDGGAIYVGYVLNADKTGFTSTGTLDTTGTLFKNNTATGTDSNMGGGAICVNKGAATLNGVELDGNKSAYYGGAISAYDATVTIQKNGDKNSVIKNSVGETGLAITFKEGDKTNNGTYVINGLNLTDNNPAKDHGVNGVIYINEGELTIENLTATGNSNTGSGVIHASTGAKLTVKNSKFENNSTDGTGAAINFVSSTGDKTLVVENTSFISNTATENGGAINAGGSTVVTITDCTFTTNESDANGGAVYVSTNTTLCIDNSTFDGNKALKGDTSSGGAIYGTKSTITITGDNTWFKNNQADRGGAIYITHSNNQPSILEMMGGKFEQNSAAEGGAVSIRKNCSATFTGTTFTSNKASQAGDGTGNDTIVEGGGAIYVGWATLNLADVTMSQNSTSVGFGGAIQVNGATFKISEFISISESTFGQTQPDNIYLHSGSIITVVGELEEGSKIGLSSSADGLVVRGGSELSAPVTDYLSTVFSHDYSVPLYAEDGVIKSGLFIIQQPTRFNGYTFSTTCTDESHYQWYVWEGGAVKIEGALGFSLTDAFAKIGQEPESGKTYLCYVTCGSARSVESNRYYYCNVEPEKLVCGENCDHDTTHESIKWLPISNAEELVKAGEAGGNYYLVQTILLEETINVAENTNISLNGFDITLADGTSGFSFFNVPAGVTLTLTDWSSTNRGGYIDENGAWMPGYYDQAESFVSLKGGVINGLGNSATSGGAIYAEGNVVVYNVDFVNHTAGNGGAIYLANGATLLTEGSSFVANECTSGAEDGDLRGGGAVYTIAAKATFKNTSFYNNKAAYYGGAVVAYGSEVSFNGGVVKENSGGTGAAICFRNDGDSSTTAKYEITNVLITYNKAVGSGVVYMNEGTLTMSDVEATNNTSTYVGGFMYVSGGVANIADTTVQSNTAKDNGGGIYINNAGATVTIKGKVIVSGNGVGDSSSWTDNNVQLSTGKLYVSGEITEGSDIGITAADGTFITLATGVENVDIADYATHFTHDGGKPVYVESGALKIGFFFTQQPFSGNAYTVQTNATGVTYQWEALDGEQWTLVEGATAATLPETAVAGSTYRCKVTTAWGENIIYSNNVTYYVETATHEHSVCGTTCSHGTHDSVTWTPVSSIEELALVSSMAGNYYLTCDIEVGASVVISADVNLCLNGHTLSAANNEDLFSILTVKSVAKFTLTDCGTEETTVYVKDGVLVDSTTEGDTAVSLTGGMITGGHAGMGAAIYSNGGSVKIYNVNFVNNAITGSGSMGGAIYVSDGALEVTGATFVANRSEYQGGAIYVSRVGSDSSPYSIADTRFIGNGVSSSNYGGGALYSTASHGTFDNVTLIDNFACKGGAVAMHSASTLTVNSLLAQGNKAVAKSDGTLGIGGVFFINAGELKLVEEGEGNTIVFGGAQAGQGNTAVSGGAIRIEGGKVTVTGAAFEYNSAEVGGAISVIAGELNITNGTLEYNTATNGGAVHATGGTVEFYSSQFNNNSAISDAEVRGGAIYSGGATLKITDTAFSGNKASNETTSSNQWGGAIYITGGSLTASNATFSNNISGYYGGAVAAAEAAVTITDGSISGSTGITGAALYFNKCKGVEINGTAITGNGHNGNVTWGSGIIYTTAGTTHTFKNITASGNNTGYNGGVFYISDSPATIEGGTFTENSAGYGGVLYVAGAASSVTISNATFGTADKGNSATTSGGAVYVASGTVNVNGATLESNTAATSGGAIYAAGGETTITGTTFTRNRTTSNPNSVTVRGGGAILATTATVTITGCTFDANESAYYGGTIAAYESTVTVKADDQGKNTTISNSIGQTGSAICFRNNSTSSGTYIIDGLDISSSSTGTSGSGVIYINDGSLNINKLKIETSGAAAGGIIHASGGLGVTVTNSTIALSTENTAPLGAINLAVNAQHKITNLTVTGDGVEAFITAGSGTLTIYDTTEPAYTIKGSGTVNKPNISTQQ